MLYSIHILCTLGICIRLCCTNNTIVEADQCGLWPAVDYVRSEEIGEHRSNGGEDQHVEKMEH